jgi:hypothetical protein
MALAQGETEQTGSFQCVRPAASDVEGALRGAFSASDPLKFSAFISCPFFRGDWELARAIFDAQR